MKAFTLFCFFYISALSIGWAQPIKSTDSSNFEQQRERVNSLLQQRGERFGEFDRSLQQKTGIFGLFKRKKDMQRSIDILREIVLTDNHIFVETKKLLDIKDGESSLNQNLATESGKEVLGYMHSITKLQNENDKLQIQLQQATEKQRSAHRLIAFLIVLFLAAGLYIYLGTRKKKN